MKFSYLTDCGILNNECIFQLLGVLPHVHLELNLFTCCVLREEEREKREADLRREVEERDKQHRETVERLQIQVRGEVLDGFISLNLLFLCTHCFHIVHHRWHS